MRVGASALCLCSGALLLIAAVSLQAQDRESPRIDGSIDPSTEAWSLPPIHDCKTLGGSGENVPMRVWIYTACDEEFAYFAYQARPVPKLGAPEEFESAGSLVLMFRDPDNNDTTTVSPSCYAVPGDLQPSEEATIFILGGVDYGTVPETPGMPVCGAVQWGLSSTQDLFPICDSPGSCDPWSCDITAHRLRDDGGISFEMRWPRGQARLGSAKPAEKQFWSYRIGSTPFGELFPTALNIGKTDCDYRPDPDADPDFCLGSGASDSYDNPNDFFRFLDTDYLLPICPEDVAPITAQMDIKPNGCPNSFSVKSKGRLPVALLGGEDFNIEDVDPDSIRLEGVPPRKWSYDDVAGPPAHADEPDPCTCLANDPDGHEDLMLHFANPVLTEISQGIGEAVDQDMVRLKLTGELRNGTPFEAYDCVRVLKKPASGGGDGPFPGL